MEKKLKEMSLEELSNLTEEEIKNYSEEEVLDALEESFKEGMNHFVRFIAVSITEVLKSCIEDELKKDDEVGYDSTNNLN